MPMNDTAWHARSADETATELRTDVGRGLVGADAAERLARHGPNAIAQAKQRSALTIVLHQFRSLIVGLLVAAGGVALALGDVIEALAILVVIVLNAVIGFVTEWKAAGALAGLRKQSLSVARVLRDGQERQLPAGELVPGDVVLLATGDRVPADGRVIEQARLQVDESALTGESLPVNKSADPVTDHEAPLGDRTSMVHMGTAVTAGRGKFIVTVTGKQTQMGWIGTLIDEVGEHGTPLEGKLAQLSRALLVIVLVLCAVIVGVGWLRGNELLFMVEVGIREGRMGPGRSRARLPANAGSPVQQRNQTHGDGAHGARWSHGRLREGFARRGAGGQRIRTRRRRRHCDVSRDTAGRTHDER